MHADTFDLHSYQTLTGTLFMLLTAPGTADAADTLRGPYVVEWGVLPGVITIALAAVGRGGLSHETAAPPCYNKYEHCTLIKPTTPSPQSSEYTICTPTTCSRIPFTRWIRLSSRTSLTAT